MKIERSKVAEILTQKGANRACHRCKSSKFSLLEDFANIMVQKDLDGSITIGGPTVPAAVVVCDNCGAITFHAIGALGLLPPQEEDNGNG